METISTDYNRNSNSNSTSLAANTSTNNTKPISTLSGEISVNVIDLIETAKKCLKEEDYNNALFFLNLILLSPSLDLSTKIATQLMNCSINCKLKNSDYLLKIARKIFKYLKDNNNNLKAIPEEIILIFMKILQKVGENCEEEGNVIYACWFFYYAKNICDFRNLKRDGYEGIKTGISRVLKKLSEEVEVTKENLTKMNKSEILRKISDYFTQNNGVTVLNLENPDETYYLVSANWVANMIVFIKLIQEGHDLENIFNTNNICLLFFDTGDEEDEVRKEVLGSYPGQINNFHLLGSSDSWTDPDISENHTNIYLSKDLRENADYLILPSEIYLKIKDIFKITKFNEIVRKSALNAENELTIEVNLSKIKVLFINDELRDSHKALLKPKHLQISKFATFSELESKLQRVFKNVIQNAESTHLNQEFDLRIYRFDRNMREVFDLVTSYANKNKSFKIIVKELKKSENGNKTINELKIGPKEILIVEVLSKGTIVKPFIRVGSEHFSCSKCNIRIKTAAVDCENCTQSLYCSIKCRSEDTVHIDYHKKVASLYKKKLSIQEISALNISNFFDTNSKGGLVGIKNLGNNCFVNSALQCLSHCEDLTKYFLSKSFLDDINKNSKQGPDGKIAKAFYDLLRELWIGSAASISPMDFKTVFSGFIKQFSANGHQDAIEVIYFFLASLHEDLNKGGSVTNTNNLNFNPESILPEEILTHKAKDNSIITDLFNGYLKTKIRCPGCKTTTTTIDPFPFLPITIPDKSTSKIRFKIFPNNFEYNYFLVEAFDVNKFTTIKDVKSKIKEVKSFKNAEFDAVLLKNKALTSVLPDDELIYDYVFTRVDFTEEEFVDIEIIFCQVETPSASKNKGDFVTFYVSPSEFFDQRYYLLLKYKEHRLLSYPKAFSVSKKGRVKDLYVEVYKYYRRVMDDKVVKKDEVEDENNNEDSKKDGNTNSNSSRNGKFEQVDTTYYENFYENIQNKEFIEKDFDKHYLGTADDGDITDHTDINKLKSHFKTSEKELFDLHFLNNIPPSNSYFFSKPACEYCKSSKCTMCKFNFSLDTKIYELYAMQQVCRPFMLLADFTKFRDNFYKFYQEFIDTSDPKSYFKGELTIFDCLDQFGKEEKFDKERPWYCQKCDRPQEAFKKVEIYEPPKYLIIQFKRFKLKGHKSLMEMVNNKKNETFVYYPISNFEITNYISGENKDFNYDLVAMIQHTGGLTGGHYTSVVKNNDKWYEINDDVINETAEVGTIISPNTYALVYKKVPGEVTNGKNNFREATKLLTEDTSINSLSAEN